MRAATMLIHWAAAFRAAGLRFVPASFVAASLGVATLTCALSAPVQAFQIAVGQAVRSKSAPAAVKAGAAVIGALQAGRAYPVLKVNGAWLQVELTVAGAPKRGWVAASQVEVAPTGAASSSSMMSSSIAASLLPPPEPPTLVQGKAAPTNIVAGKQTLGVLRPGEFAPLLETRGEWLKIGGAFADGATEGWVSARAAASLPASAAAPGWYGWTPASITSAVATVDWKTNVVELRVAVPRLTADAELRLLVPPGAPPSRALPTLETQGDAIRLSGDVQDFVTLCPPGTRSLWIEEATAGEPRRHRVDLPPPGLGLDASLKTYAKAEGVLLSLPTVNLLPGTVLEIAEAAPGGAFGLPAPVGKTKGVLPRLVDAYVGPTGGAPALRVYLPPAVSAQSKTFYRFRLRGPDGSISETIAFTRVGDAIPAPATVAVRGLAAPVDATTVAPVVELLSAGDAKAVLEYAGLSAAFVAFGSQRPVAAEQLRNALVLGQGVAPGERVLRGERVTLAIESSEPPLIVEPQPIGGGLVALDDVPLRDLTEGAKTSLGPAAIDVGDFAGFVDLRTPGAPPRRPKEADDESRLLDESELTGASGLAGLIDGPRPGDPLKPGERVKPGDAWGGLVRIELDPGLSLPIDRTPEENVVAGLLKLVVLALFEQPSPLDLPGALGAAVRDALLKHELAWRKALERVDPNNEPPFADVLDTVTKSLKVSLSNNDKQQALEAWRRYARLRPRLWQLDRNRNVFVTDDAAVWAIEWMIQRGLLNPATLIEVKLQIDGPPLAVLPPIPSLPDWIDSTPPPLVIPNGPTVSPPSVGPRPPQPNGPAKPNPPTNPNKPTPPSGPPNPPAPPRPPVGPALAQAEHGPDEVRMPNLVRSAVAPSARRLAELGLKIGGGRRFFESDLIMRTTPRSGTWTPSGEAVELAVERRVPDLAKWGLSQATARLKELGFEPAPAEGSLPADVVMEQSPGAGEYREIGATVSLDTAAIVPNVLRMLLADATAKLDERGLKWRSDTKAFKVDLVVEQSKPVGSLARHGDALSLVLHVKTPSVLNLSLDRAVTVLEQWDLNARKLTELAHLEDVVRGQDVNSGEYVPHGSTVGLGPITTTAPDVVGERMARATSLLRDEEDFTVSIVGRDELRDDDLVTMQTPRAGTQIERGERITLDARVTAPEVQGGSIASAKRRIDRAAGSLSWRVRDEYFEEDLVYSQTPQPGELIYPRTEISLTPGVSLPNVSGMTPNQAARAIEGVGLAWRITSSGTRETINRNEVGGVYIDGQSPRAGFYPRRNLGEIRLSETQYVMAMRDVPNLVRTRMSDAVQGLASEGFVPVIVVDGQRMSLREWLSGVTERARTLYQEAEARARENETLDQLPSFNEFLENFNSRVGGQYPRGGERVEYGTTVELYPAMTK